MGGRRSMLRAGTGAPVLKRLGPGEGNHHLLETRRNLCHWGERETGHDLVTELGKAGPRISRSGVDRKSAGSSSPGRPSPGAATGAPVASLTLETKGPPWSQVGLSFEVRGPTASEAGPGRPSPSQEAPKRLTHVPPPRQGTEPLRGLLAGL